MKPNTPAERLYNGIIKENPTFVLMLGMCPTLAITTSATNGIGMGLTTTVILAASNLMISLLRNFIPDRVRMPAFIVVVASFVTVVQLLLQGFIPRSQSLSWHPEHSLFWQRFLHYRTNSKSVQPNVALIQVILIAAEAVQPVAIPCVREKGGNGL